MKFYKDLTIIIITFKSDEIIYKFIDNIPKKIKIIVVENSINFELKKKLEKKYKNVQVYLRKNLGVSSSLNYAVKKTKTNYFLHLSPDLKVNYKDIKEVINKFNLKKNGSNFILEGDSFNAVKMINNVIDNDTESSSIFQNLNTKIDIKIKKTYIDEINYLNNLSGYINFKDNKINDLKLDSVFPNKKKI